MSSSQCSSSSSKKKKRRSMVASEESSLRHRSHAAAEPSPSDSSSDSLPSSSSAATPALPLPSTPLSFDPSDHLALVTVGTTQFDSLISALNSEADSFIGWLIARGFTRLLLQLGTGRVLPLPLLSAAARLSPASRPLRVEWVGLMIGLPSAIAAARLVISHAGAGSILESLRASRPLIVVVNQRLMHNHQQELATALAEGRFLYAATPESLMQVMTQGRWDEPTDEEEEKEDDEAERRKKKQKAVTATGANDASSAVSYRLRRYPPVDSAAFPRLLGGLCATQLQHATSGGSDSGMQLRATIVGWLLPAIGAAIATCCLCG